MKKILIILTLILLLVVPQVWAAGTVTQTWATVSSNTYLLTFTCTADVSAKTYPATDSKHAIDGYVFLVITDPGTTSPTDDYDITLNDDNGIDIMGGELANRDETNSEQAVPKIDAVYGSRWVDGVLEIAVTGNSVASAVTVVKVFIYR